MVSSKIVLCSGCWDILHIGHLRHLQAARRYGDWLVVSVTKYAYVKKGPRRPVFSDRERREMVGALNCVDQTVLVADQLEAFEMVKPHVLVKGGDYLTRIEPEHRDYCKAHGIEIVFTNEAHYSSTDLLHYYDRSEPR